VGKPWYKSKMIWANIIAVAVAILASLGTFPGLLPAEFSPWVLFVIGALNIVLRFLTNEPITTKKG